jgi:anti-sigma-K factor RskA
MIDEAKQQTAIDYVLGALPPAEAIAFEKELAANEELREFIRELNDGYASLAFDAPLTKPSRDLFSRVLTQIATTKRRRFPPVSAVPWALAACLAIVAAVVGIDDFRGKQEIAELNRRDVIAHLQIASLRAQVDSFAKASAVVVWNAEGQRGLIRLKDVPNPENGRDYQLWIIDPSKKEPVSAGVVPVTRLKAGDVEFRPEHPVAEAAKFAVSIEKAGGAPEPQGPIVLVGE